MGSTGVYSTFGCIVARLALHAFLYSAIQMAGTADVLTSVKQRPSVRYPVLVPNVKGLENLLDLLHSHPTSRQAQPLTNEIAIFTAASESFCKANTNKSISESLDTLAKVTEQALSAGLFPRGWL